MELQQNASNGQGMDLDKNIAYNQHTGLQQNVSQPVDPEVQQNIGRIIDFEQNIAYGRPTELERNISYDQPTKMKQNVVYGLNHTDDNRYEYPDTMRSVYELSKGCNQSVVNKNIQNGFKASTITASIALVLTLLALIAAIVATSLGAHGTVTGSSQEILILQKQLSLLNETVTAALAMFWNPMRSCKNVPRGSPSGDYWILADGTISPVQVYCDTNRTSCSCNTTGGWMRVANLDMTDPNQNCPAEFQLVNRTSAPLRMCGRPGPAGCVSTTFQTYGVEYSHVCGRVIGYQDQTPAAFVSGHPGESKATTIDSFYVDGVSLTYGQSPRQHIWTFAGAADELTDIFGCPCTRSDISYTGKIPSFVGQDYFCDTGSREAHQHNVFYADDPLWDGQGCGGTSTCCEFNNPPWFCKQLPQPTTDDIELRICGDLTTSDEDTPIEQIEIYVH